MAKAKKLPSGNWRVQVYDKINGKYKSFTAPTKKEAEYKAAEYSLHANSSNSYEDMTLREAYERYINSKSAVLSPSTVREYTRASRRDFPRLMLMPLNKITPQTVQNAINDIALTLSPKSVRDKHGLLHSVLKVYRPELILNTRLPQNKKPTRTIPTTKEINLLLDCANNKIKVPILLASTGGLRRSEICALTPGDFDSFGVTINKAKVRNSDNVYVIKQPKTNAGYRYVPLPPQVISEALKWEHFGMMPYTLEKSFHNLVKNLDIPHTTFHKLRHYFASELHAKGIPDQYIAEIGGWESVEMLHKVYQHTLRDKKPEMSKKIVNIFSDNFKETDDKEMTCS